MSLWRVVVADQDYDFTVYTSWVSASSKTHAIAMGACLAGAEKMRREYERTGPEPVAEDGLLMQPTVKLEPVGTDEYYQHQHQVS